jgi:hypothetical protein
MLPCRIDAAGAASPSRRSISMRAAGWNFSLALAEFISPTEKKASGMD